MANESIEDKGPTGNRNRGDAKSVEDCWEIFRITQ